MADGDRKPIEDIAVDDVVRTYNLNSKALEANRVESLLKYRVNELVVITLNDA
eukprot:CAMPEP_0202699320 /NCGR_PEP_ID=MMETSP1385-20130828/12540_1 /ASSEMBLY_ACC=CAM_ASM_000861 /TAXON_ID=933848 /ORGANISM="Elphidium margaritaceum" /LENGTH=52 /DNA_ID=CAMNT_0049356229 /DNA_START=85 /DNA_END=239 /DNA_ORIENTATION=-